MHLIHFLARLSLTQRLTLFFSVVAALVVLGLGALFLTVTDRHFDELDRMALQDKQYLIEKVLQHANSTEDARWRLGDALSYHEGLVALVQDARGRTVFRSKEFDPAAGIDVASSSDRASGVWKHGGTVFHTLGFAAAAAYSATPLHVWIVLDTQVHAHFLRTLQRSLLVYVMAALVLCALLSWLAAHRGLAPLRDMKTRAARVTGQQLGERMPVQAVPVEMADLARELNRMLDRLQADFQRLVDFSADLAHELRTPISNLLTQTQVALATPRDAAAYRDILASNAEEFERLARMVSDMLFLAKTSRGVDLPRKTLFSARTDARALLDFYEAVAEEKGIRLHLTGAGEIEGDRLMFRRAVSNLLSNAVRHTPQNGEITLAIANSEQATTVTVTNTGQDIDPERLPRLFDRFYRADPARSHLDADGAGLGLAITRAIAEAHGGYITATSAGGLTRFILTFPREGRKT